MHKYIHLQCGAVCTCACVSTWRVWCSTSRSPRRTSHTSQRCASPAPAAHKADEGRVPLAPAVASAAGGPSLAEAPPPGAVPAARGRPRGSRRARSVAAERHVVRFPSCCWCCSMSIARLGALRRLHRSGAGAGSRAEPALQLLQAGCPAPPTPPACSPRRWLHQQQATGGAR